MDGKVFECCACGEQTTSPYLIDPITQRRLKGEKAYCANCYENLIRRQIRFDKTIAERIEKRNREKGSRY
jgi:recombinational DNA repair protein (RecF pathway)